MFESDTLCPSDLFSDDLPEPSVAPAQPGADLVDRIVAALVYARDYGQFETAMRLAQVLEHVDGGTDAPVPA